MEDPTYDPQAYNERFSVYTSHKTVRAAEITSIWGTGVVGIAPDGFSVTFDPAGKPTPRIGWYVIAYDDGYVSFCPPEQFEKGYAATKAPTPAARASDWKIDNGPIAPVSKSAPLHASTFEYLKPTGEQIDQMQAVREWTRDYATVLSSCLPDGPDKTYVLRKLREIGMWANVAITREADGSPRVPLAGA